MEHRPIPYTVGSFRVRRIQYCLHFIVREISDQCLVSLFSRDSMNASGLVDTRGDAILHEAKKRFNRCEPRVACSRRVFPLDFEIAQELKYQLCIEIFKMQRGWSSVTLLRGKEQEELESIGVGVPCVDADLSFTQHVILQERAQMRSQGGSVIHRQP